MKDQWDYDNRDRGAVMITDEAAFLTPLPTAEQLSIIRRLDPHNLRATVLKGNPPAARAAQ
jgi:glutaconate CoA-transferase subunit B